MEILPKCLRLRRTLEYQPLCLETSPKVEGTPGVDRDTQENPGRTMSSAKLITTNAMETSHFLRFRLCRPGRRWPLRTDNSMPRRYDVTGAISRSRTREKKQSLPGCCQVLPNESLEFKL